MSMEDWKALFSTCYFHIKTQSPACGFSHVLLPPTALLRHPPILVAYAWRVVADVAHNDADGTHSPTEWKRS